MTDYLDSYIKKLETKSKHQILKEKEEIRIANSKNKDYKREYYLVRNDTFDKYRRKKKGKKTESVAVTKRRDMPYREYLQTHYWKKVRKKALRIAGYKCEICGCPDSLAIHHESYDHRGDEYNHLDDLVCLCKWCHNRLYKNKLLKEREQILWL